MQTWEWQLSRRHLPLKGEIYARFLGRGSCAPTLKVVPAGEIGFAVVICTDDEDAMILIKVLRRGQGARRSLR
jgi:hypothetical protein